MNYKYIPETTSTNSLARQWIEQGEYNGDNLVLYTDFQTSGHGQKGNSWESEQGKNLLFTLCVQPKQLPAIKQFLLSEAICIALLRVLNHYIHGVKIKWPNDIYYQDSKIAGILIENVICGSNIQQSYIGVGLNVNQKVFKSEAPNPISLSQLVGYKIDRTSLLHEIIEKYTILTNSSQNFCEQQIHSEFLDSLYRHSGVFPWLDKDGYFSAEIVTVEPTGILVLKDSNGAKRSYMFKEVKYVFSDRQSY